jgi:hypothetical protein
VVFTLNERLTLNKTWAKDYKKELRHRLLGSDMSEEFIEQFIERRDAERDLKSADAVSPASYEEELEHLVGEAAKDYEHYWVGRQGRVQKGNIRPKKRQRGRKASSVAGACERQEALARYLASAASEDERIISFRNDVLSGHVLSEEEALTFLSAPVAAAKGKRSSFKLLRINPLDRILDTNYEVEEGQDDRGPYRKLVWGRRRPRTVRPLLVTRRLIFPGDSVTPDDLHTLRRGRAVIFPHPREENRFVVAAHNSFIGQSADIVEKSMGGYPISQKMGVWFILTGEFVPEDPVRIRYTTVRRPWLMSRTTITLEVESWLPPEEILEQYRHAQHEILGKTPRSLKRNTLAVFAFVNQHREKSWRKLFDAWNKQHPRNEHFQDPRHLYTTYTRALENVAGIKPTKAKRLKIAGTDSSGRPIYADKWYLLHPGGGYTGSFESREEASADSRSENSEVLTAKQLVARLAGRARNN